MTAFTGIQTSNKMSFSGDVKNELCRRFPVKQCDCIAECYGVLLYCNTFTAREVRIITENTRFAERLPRLFESAFGCRFDETKSSDTGKNSFIISDRKTLEAIFDAFGFSADDTLSHHINLGVLENDCCLESFLRGAFLAGGSVTDPVKSYHFELVTPHYHVANELYVLLCEAELPPKSLQRSGNFITYYKQSAAIEDFLMKLDAPQSAMALMEAKIEKEVRNSVNRRVNCDTANVSKTVDAVAAQLEAISRLELDDLPERLRETAQLRLEYPELSLTELAGLFDPPMTKSGLNHRLRNLKKLAEDTK